MSVRAPSFAKNFNSCIRECPISFLSAQNTRQLSPLLLLLIASTSSLRAVRHEHQISNALVAGPASPLLILSLYHTVRGASGWAQHSEHVKWSLGSFECRDSEGVRTLKLPVLYILAQFNHRPLKTREIHRTMLDDGFRLYLATSALALVIFSCCRKYRDKQSGPPLPPGPMPLPIVGNVLSLDTTQPWLTFNAWKSTYGDIIYARLLNKPVIVINSEEVAKDLFEARSTIYSDRPQSIVYPHFASDFNPVLMPYGDRWRLHRRIFHQAFRQTEIPTYHAVQLRSAHKMLFSVLQDPSDYSRHLEMFSISFILPMMYDYEPKAKDDPIAYNMKRYLNRTNAALTPGVTVILETFPFLLKLPSWFPGAIFKRASLDCLKAGHDIKEIPFQMVEERMSTGITMSCFVADTLSKTKLFAEDDAVIITAVKEAASMTFAAGFETTTSTLLVFILAMVLNPEVQAKAQAEIDRIVGKDRLPDFNDRPSLPYVDAILRETFRWHPVVPFGVPRTTTTSDIYKGYFIPEGIVLFANTWAMTHDEKKYPSPDEFKPERFLHEDGSLTSDTMPLGFGWGRRNCVGRYVVDASLWIAITSFLAMFSVHNALDEHGIDIPVVPKFTTGLIVHPEKFPCRIVPRFPNASVKTLTHLTGLGSCVDIA